MIPVEVYHGTTSNWLESIQSGIDLNRARRYADFGRGFYTTSNFNQAMRWARGRAKAHNDKETNVIRNQLVDPIVMKFTVDVDLLIGFSHCIFKKPDEKWAEFVYNNRTGESYLWSDFHNWDRRYDFVFGYVADGPMLTLIEQAKAGDIDPANFHKMIQPMYPDKDDQLSFHTLRAVECLTLKEVIYDVAETIRGNG